MTGVQTCALPISNGEKDLIIIGKYELKDDEEFIIVVKDLIEKHSQNESILFNKFLSLFNISDFFEFNYYNANDMQITTNFNIKKLIDIQVIKPNENQGEKDLSKIFSQIIKYKYAQESHPRSIDFQDKIETFNDDMSKDIENEFTSGLNDVIGKLHDKNTLQVYLNSNLNFDELLDKLVRYQYKENGLHIPENQFGLGYRNLMRIIGELIDYVEKYPDGDKHSKLNLICIEEPEVFMHPQMQELFINYINEAINTLLGGSAKRLNSQLIISTHSAHILNSKIHSSNSLNNINYIYERNNLSNVVNLKDSQIISSEKIDENETDDAKEKRTKEELSFIKKHIKFKASELFFADAIIFVEGITEEVLLSYYISIDKQLNKKYITIFNINGAHGLVYHHLIKLLDVPTLVITDLDIKRSEQEKKDFIQIDNLKTRTTTNKTIVKYNLKDSIDSLSTSHFKDNNLYIAFQGDKIEDFYATSLEESLILSNYNNDILNTTIQKVKPEIYQEILTDSNERKNLIQYSYKLQRKLSSSKSDFANELLYQLSINEEDNLPELPNYIKDALEWLKTELGFTQDEE